jgi:hypothetical protein
MVTEKIHDILIETIWLHASMYYTVKNRAVKVKRGDFPLLLRVVLEDPKQ